MTRMYHNPRCSKSRQTLALLQEQGIEPELILYLKQPPTTDELRTVLEQLGLAPRDLLRTGESMYKELSLSDPTHTEDALIEAMVLHPKLIQRPIVIHGEKAALGRPPEDVLALFASEDASS